MQESFVYPPVYIDRTIINSGTDDQNKVKVNLLLCLKAAIGSESLTTLQPDYLTIKILEVRDERISAILQKSSELIVGMIENPLFEPDQIFRKLAKRIRLTPGDTVEQFRRVFSENTKIHVVTNDDIKGIDSVNRISRSNQQSILDIYVKKSLPEIDDTEHLSYYIYSSYDKKKIQESTNFIISDSNLSKNIKITGETIINKGKISSESYVFYLEDDTTWTGEVHRDDEDEEWYTGKFSERNKKDSSGNYIKQPLVRRSVYNTKIQDFRTYKKIQSALNNYQEIVKNFEDFEIVDNPNNSYIIKSTDSPIVWKQGNVNKVSVQCTLEHLLRKSSMAYNRLSRTFFERRRWAESINVRVYRKRVIELPSANHLDKKSDYLFDFSQNEKKIYIKSEDIQVTAGERFLNIDIRDTSLPRTGDYCYGVELYFFDPVVKELEILLNSAREGEANLLKYSENCKIISYTDVAGNYFEGNYDQELNKFTDQFNTDINRNIVSDSVSIYAKMASYISHSPEMIESELLELVKLISPTTGTPDNVISFISVYRTCLSILDRIYNSSKNINYIFEEKYFNKISHKIRNIKREVEGLKYNSRKVNFFENIEKRNMEQLCDLCSLSIKKVKEETRESVIDRNMFPTGISIGYMGIGVADLFNGLSIGRGKESDSSRNPALVRKKIGNNIILSDLATNPPIDYNETLRKMSKSSKTSNSSRARKRQTFSEITNTNDDLFVPTQVERVPNKHLDFGKDESEIKSMLIGIQEAPKDTSSKIVSSVSMIEVASEQSSRKKKLKKRIGK